MPRMTGTETLASDVVFENIARIVDERKRGEKSRLAEVLGVTPPRITEWLRERPDIRVNTLQAIASALDVPVSSLFQENLQKAAG